MMRDPIIELRDVGKSITGKQIVRDLNLALFPGEIFVFRGANAAGYQAIANRIARSIEGYFPS